MADERRGSPSITTDQSRAFIEHLSKSANVTASADVAGFNRSTAYDMRKADPEFAAAWDDAIEQSTDTLISVARKRAIEGTSEPVVSMGRIVTDAGGKILALTRYSDTLMIALLKAHRPSMFNAGTPVAPYGGSGVGVGVPAELRPDPVPTPDEGGPDKPIL